MAVVYSSFLTIRPPFLPIEGVKMAVCVVCEDWLLQKLYICLMYQLFRL